MPTKSDPHQPKDISPLRRAVPQVLAVLVKNILLLGYGMTLGFPTILIPSLSGSVAGEKITLGEEGISWIGSINLICVPFGCLLSGSITHAIGRRRTMQLVNIPFLLAWLLFHFSTEAWQVYLALCLTGLTGGLLEAPVITYVAEITEPRLRGILSTTSTASINLGILCSYICGTFLPWRRVVLVNCAVPVVGFICLMFVPESPYWLIEKNRLNDAKKSLAWLRGWTTLNNVDEEFIQLCRCLGKAPPKSILNKINNLEYNGNVLSIDKLATPKADTILHKKLSKKETLKLFAKKSFIWPFCTVSFAFFLGHFGGNSNLQTYAVKIFAAIKSPLDKYYATILVGVVQLLGVIVSLVSINFLGKRVINFISLTGCVLCFVSIAVYTQLVGVTYLDTVNSTSINNLPSSHLEETLETLNWLPMTLLIFTAFLSYLGIKSLPWVLVGEVFNNEVRPVASGVVSGVGYLLGFLSNKCFLGLVNLITLPGVMWFYTLICGVGLVTLYFILPETEGKTLFEISEHYAGRGKLDNKVYRKRKSKVDGNVNKGYVEEDVFKDRYRSETIF